jgi:ferrochelatase
MAEDKRRIGVVLFQLGGPDSLQAIEPFLFNLFCDPDIIDFPFARLGRRPLAKLISTTRAKKVEHHYEVIGGCSPIRRHTEQQARALEAELRREGIDSVCVVAMRYWHPFTHEAIEQLRAADVDEVVLLPMYPQYSITTTGSSLNEWERQSTKYQVQGTKWPERAEEIAEFYRHPLYLESICEKIESTLQRFPHPDQAELVFSAHSVPVAVIEKGDPYQRQIEETVALVMQRGGWRNPHRLCYQSKVGASKWLQPSLRTTVRDMAAADIKDVCVVPIAFVSDHVETLGEIDHEAREQAMALGIRQFEMTPGLNDSPTFIRALAELVMEKVRPATMASGTESLMAAD